MQIFHRTPKTRRRVCQLLLTSLSIAATTIIMVLVVMPLSLAYVAHAQQTQTAAPPKAQTAETQTDTNKNPPTPTEPKPPTLQKDSADKNAAQNPGREVGDNGEVKVNTDLVTMTVTVTDFYDRCVTGLKREHFKITDNKLPQDIVFFSDDDAPVSLGVVFDVSGSMSDDKITRAREALAKFIETSHEKDEYFLVGFNSRAELLLDRTRDSDALLNKLTYVETKGNTALYDAAYLGIEKVARGAHDKKAILLISDGQDNNSRYTFRELQKLLKESGVIIYSVGIVGSRGGADDARGQAYLDELSSVSGGKAFFPSTSAEMNDTFERIAIELRSQYSIGYRPSNFAADGKWHNVKIKVTPPRGMSRLAVRAKDGYYAK